MGDIYVYCVVKGTKEVKILKENLTKQEAIEWIEKNKDKYPECEYISFGMKGLAPLVD